MKSTLFSFILLFSALGAFAQLGLTYKWTKSIPSNVSSGTTTHFSIADNLGNVYNCGSFQNTVDFDPGSAVFNLTAASSGDGYLQKLDVNGNFVWAVHWDYFKPSDIEITNSNEILIAGYFSGTIDCDPGVGVTTVTSGSGNNNNLALKFNSNGNLMWAYHASTTGNSFGPRIQYNPLNNDVFLFGFFAGNLTPNPNNGSLVIPSSGGQDGFAIQISASGNYIRNFHVGSSGSDMIRDIAFDNIGNTIIVGNFASTVDFDPGIGVSNLTATSVDGFIASYNSSGQFIQAIKQEGTGANYLDKIISNNTGGWILAGVLANGITDLDLGSGTINFDNSNAQANYFIEVSSSFNYIRSATLAGGTNVLTDFFKVPNGRIYINGHFKNNVDFDPGIGTNNINYSNTGGQYDEYTLLLNFDFTFNEVITRAGSTINFNSYGPFSFKHRSGKIYKSGSFAGTVDFDPTSGVDNRTAVSIDYFSSVYALCSTPIYANTSASSCLTYTSPSGKVINNSGTYIDTIPSVQGCDSIITINLTIIQPSAPAASVLVSSDSICQGSAVTFNAATTLGGTSPMYTWFLNGSAVGSSNSYTTFTLSNNDLVHFQLISNASCITTSLVNSDTVKMIVGNPGAIPTISIATDTPTSICEGTQVTCIATITNGGNYPSYYWELNGQQVGNNSAQYITSNLTDQDELFCSLISSDGCLLTTQAGSNIIQMDVAPVETPFVSISGPNIICAGDNAIYTSTSTGAGSNPIYNWYINSNPASVGSGPNLTISSLQNNDILNCVLVNNDACASTNFHMSNGIQVSVQTSVNPTISIAASQNSACGQEVITFTSTVSGEGSLPGYQWTLNGNNFFGGTNATFQTTSLNDQDVVNCILASSLSCANQSTVTSNSISVTINQLPDVSVIQNGNTLNAVTSSANYQWIDCSDNSLVLGQNNQTFAPTLPGDYAVIIDNGTCSDTSICYSVTGVGINENEIIAVQCYPNPTEGIITIKSKTKINAILVTDLTGKMIISINNVDKTESTTDLMDYPSGIYFVNVKNVNQDEQTFKVIKD